MDSKKIYKLALWFALFAAVTIAVHGGLHVHDITEESHCVLCQLSQYGIVVYSVLLLLSRLFKKTYLPASDDVPNLSDRTNVYNPRSPPFVVLQHHS